MGNSIHGVSLFGVRPYHLRLGNYVSIDIDVTKEDDFKPIESWRLLLPHNYTNEKKDIKLKSWDVSYTIEGSKCQLWVTLIKWVSAGSDSQEHELRFVVTDSFLQRSMEVLVSKAAETNLLLTSIRSRTLGRRKLFDEDSIFFSKNTKSTSSSSNDTLDTNVYLYGKPSKGGGGLVVLESKKKSADENPYLVTLAHYYIPNTGKFFDYIASKSFDDFGLSTIAKVRRSNDTGFDITVEGPTQHPTTALVYMFDEVRKTGIWKPTTCPHCASVQKQRVAGHGMSLLQSDSEDNSNLLQLPRRNAPNINLGRTANNNGAFNGNLNGSFLNVGRGLFF